MSKSNIEVTKYTEASRLASQNVQKSDLLVISLLWLILQDYRRRYNLEPLVKERKKEDEFIEQQGRSRATVAASAKQSDNANSAATHDVLTVNLVWMHILILLWRQVDDDCPKCGQSRNGILHTAAAVC